MSLKDTCALYSVDLYQYESHLLYILFRKEVTRRGQRIIILLPLLLPFSCAWCFEHCDIKHTIKHTIHVNVYTNDHWHQNRPALHDSIYTMYTYVYNKNNKKNSKHKNEIHNTSDTNTCICLIYKNNS